jgi:acetyl esterase/lipase
MFRFILSILFLLVSLLTICPIPAKQVWYLAIAVSEFSWVWMMGVILLLVWNLAVKRYRTAALLINLISLGLFASPLLRADAISHEMDNRLRVAFGDIPDLPAPHRKQPFSYRQIISGIGAAAVPFTTMDYTVHDSVRLSLRLYPSQLPGLRPCLLVVHGGGWHQSDYGELPDVSSYFARAGYQVVSINYRLAPEFKSPAPQEDVQAAISYLKAHGRELNIDTTAFVLMGRSAGGQIVLTAAYSLHDPAIRGVISFYGPTDMYWAYNHPDNPLVMHSQQVMADFFGGSPAQVPNAYTAGSPTHYITHTTVPTLFVHGMIDAHVHYDEAVLLKHKLDAAGVPNMLLGLPWATHGCEYSLNGPSGQLAVYAVERFLAKMTSPRPH